MVLDEPAVRRLLLSFDRKVLKNGEMRVKFSDNASKFMDSEVDLFAVLQELHVLSTQPEMYPVLTDHPAFVSNLMGMLSHDNADLACAAVLLIQELTDMDEDEERDDVLLLMQAMVKEQLTPLLVSNMSRLSEEVKEESEGIFNTMAIFENMTDVDPALIADAKPLIQWILNRFKAKNIPFNSNKLYASEILSILVQDNEENKKILGSQEGMDVLLQQVAHYKKHDPASSDEHEFMDNLFNIICSCLFACPGNRQLFYTGEGIELMILILKEKRRHGLRSSVKMGALRVLSHILTADGSAASNDDDDDDVLQDSCKKFVEMSGLRVLFPVFMKPRIIVAGVKKREVAASTDQVEEQCLTILLSLLRFCDTDVKKRMVAKFVEFEYEKTERLLELHYKFHQKLEKFDEDNDDEDEDEGYVKRLTEGGLFVLQMIDQLMIMCCLMYDEYFSDHTEQESIRERLLKLLKMHAVQVDHLQRMRDVLTQMAGEVESEEEKKRLLDLVSRF